MHTEVQVKRISSSSSWYIVGAAGWVSFFFFFLFPISPPPLLTLLCSASTAANIMFHWWFSLVFPLLFTLACTDPVLLVSVRVLLHPPGDKSQRFHPSCWKANSSELYSTPSSAAAATVKGRSSVATSTHGWDCALWMRSVGCLIPRKQSNFFRFFMTKKQFWNQRSHNKSHRAD